MQQADTADGNAPSGEARQDASSVAAEASAAERLNVLELALDLAAAIEAARLRLPGWLALGSGVVLLYMIARPAADPPDAADLIVVLFVALATAVLVGLEYGNIRQSRAALRSLPRPRDGGPTS